MRLNFCGAMALATLHRCAAPAATQSRSLLAPLYLVASGVRSLLMADGVGLPPRFFHWTVDQFLEVFNPPNAVVGPSPVVGLNLPHTRSFCTQLAGFSLQRHMFAIFGNIQSLITLFVRAEHHSGADVTTLMSRIVPWLPHLLACKCDKSIKLRNHTPVSLPAKLLVLQPLNFFNRVNEAPSS